MSDSQVKVLVRNACLESSVSGLKYLYLYPDTFSRTVWSASMLSVLAWACALVWQLWSRFIELPTRVAIRDQFAPVYALPFPAVTLCSPNQVAAARVAHLRRTLVDGNVTVDLEEAVPLLLGFYEQIPVDQLWKLADLQAILQLNRYEMREVMSSLPQPCAAFLRACYWESARADCGALFAPVLTRSGLCCAFNSQYRLFNYRNMLLEKFEPRKPRFYGATFGLTLVVDYRSEPPLPRTLLNEGATELLFHDSLEFPSYEERTMVPPHVESYHIIKATVTNCSEEVAALPAESRQCVLHGEREMRYFRYYRNSQCDAECGIAELQRRCGCAPHHAPPPLRAPPCDANHIACLVRARSHQANSTPAPERCDCPRDCMSRKYKVKSVLGNLRALRHLFHDQYEGVEFTPSSTIMHIYYQNPFYTVQKQEIVMSYVSLISNLGGVFGLCLGCSVISLLELLFLLGRLLAARRRRLRAPALFPHNAQSEMARD